MTQRKLAGAVVVMSALALVGCARSVEGTAMKEGAGGGSEEKE